MSNRVDEYKHESLRCGRLVQGVVTQNIFCIFYLFFFFLIYGYTLKAKHFDI